MFHSSLYFFVFTNKWNNKHKKQVRQQALENQIQELK